LAAYFDGSLVHEMSIFPRSHSNGINSAVYNFDGKKILSASFDRTIKEWDVESGQCLKTFTGHEEMVRSACYRGDGKKILSASEDKFIKEWDVESGQCLKTFTGHKSFVSSAHYSEDGKKILSASWSLDNIIKEWDVESGQCLKTYKGTYADLKPEENPEGNGEKLQICGNKIEIRDGNTFPPIRTFINIPGLFIQGCSFKNLHPDSDLSEESKNLMRQYGAVMDE
jgi:WD40 repeat protein